MKIILSSYPLSKKFIDKFDKLIDSTATPMPLNELKRQNLFRFVLSLRKKRISHIYIASEEASAPVTLPVMQIFSYMIGAKRISFVESDFSLTPISLMNSINTVLYYILSVFLGFYDLVCVFFRVCWLSMVPRNDSFRFENQSLFYIKANLWFGVKAGGSVGHVVGVLNAFIKKDWNVRYFSSELPDLASKLVNFSRIHFPRSYIYPTDINNIVYDRAMTREVKRFGQVSNFKGAIYQRMSVFNCTGAIVSRALKKPLILEYNGSEVWVFANWGRPSSFTFIAKLCEKVSLKHAHLIVTVSSVLKEELIHRGVEEERIVVYPNCIDPEQYDDYKFSSREIAQKRSEFGCKPESIVVTFVGTFGMWHGVNILASSIKYLIDHQLEDVKKLNIHFLLVGDGFMMPEVKSQIGGHSYKPYVTFTGIVPQPEGALVLSSSDILLSPHKANDDGSRFFGSPTKLFEYMGVRKPIIASDLEQISEVISPSFRSGEIREGLSIEDQVGILCNPGDTLELADAIIKVSQNVTGLSKLGLNARSKVTKLYTWDIHVEKIIQGFHSYKSKRSLEITPYNLKEKRKLRYYQVGPLPPPYGGVSIFVKRYSSRIAKRYKLQPIDTRRISLQKLIKLFFDVVFYPKPFIIHLNSINLLALTLLKLRIFPYYLRLQDHSERNMENYSRFKRAYLGLLLRRVDELILVGPHLTNYYSVNGVQMPVKVRVRTPFIPPPLSDEQNILASYPDGLRQFLKSRSPVLIMNAYKITFYNGIDLYGFDMSIDLLKSLVTIFPNVGMIFALADSSDNEELEKIRQKIHDLRLEKHSYFLTNQRQIWPLFKRVDLMIRPTSQDGYGISVAEAIYLNCPTIASDACLRPKGTILFKTRDGKDLYRKTTSALNKMTSSDEDSSI